MVSTSYDAALAALYQAPHRAFVAERDRLASELRSAGDRAGAARLRERRRPSLSAWAVNQLYWHQRGALDALWQAAARLRAGDLGAASAHREALSRLRELAEERLTREGHAATNATLERVTTTLAAVAAAGTFDPDPPGALSMDRDPTGFDFATAVVSQPEAKPARRAKPVASKKAEREEAARLRRERERAEAAAKRRREKQERERRRVADSMRKAKSELAARTREVDRVRRELARAEAAVDRARAAHEALAAQLAELDSDE